MRDAGSAATATLSRFPSIRSDYFDAIRLSLVLVTGRGFSLDGAAPVQIAPSQPADFAAALPQIVFLVKASLLHGKRLTNYAPPISAGVERGVVKQLRSKRRGGADAEVRLESSR